MTPATSFVSKPSSLPTPWSSWTTKSPVRRSAKVASARPSRRSARGGRLRKTCVSGEQDEPELAPDEAAPRGRDGEQELRLLGQLLARLEDARVGAPQQVLASGAPRRRAGRRRRRGCRRGRSRQLGLGLGEAARGDRRPLGLEGERLALRERDRARTPRRARSGSSPSSAQTRRTSSGCQTKSGGRVEQRHEVVRHLVRGGVVVVRERRLVQVGDSLGRRVDDRVLDRVQRTLREGREGAHLLDLVAEELDRAAARGPSSGRRRRCPPRTANWPRSSARSTRS